MRRCFLVIGALLLLTGSLWAAETGVPSLKVSQDGTPGRAELEFSTKLGSDFAWQVFPTVGLDVSKRASIEFGYRWLDLNYESGEGLSFFKYDVLTQGPALGFVFKF